MRLRNILLIIIATMLLSIAAVQAKTVENLDRGLVAMKTSEGIYLSWRLRADEDYNSEFVIYRDGQKIAQTELTNYIDKDGNMDSGYQIAIIENGAEQKKSDWAMAYPMGSDYFDIQLDKPQDAVLPNGESVEYVVGDATCGDCDGDGVYEIIQMWVAGAKDNSQDGYTGNVLIDAYKIDGSKLWRIDLGKNIRAGAHYTQMIAADFNSDGICELALKTAPGSVDGLGRYVTEVSLDESIKNADNSVDYRNTSGKILDGPEYFTVFSGKDGSALDTIYYPVPRGGLNDWGDDFGNRVDRFLGCAAYLDGEKPSIVTWRGYYTRMTASAYDLTDGRLVLRNSFDTDISGEEYEHQGNHSIVAVDVDNDGKDEIISGSICLDDDMSIKWCSYRGHGDAHHIGWYDKESETPIYFSVHEQGDFENHDGIMLDYGMTVYDASNGEEIFHKGALGDTPRGIMGNFGIQGDYQFWSGGGSYAYENGEFVNLPVAGSDSFRIFWDGDIYDELLDGRSENGYAIISKYSQESQTFYNLKMTNVSGGTVINGTKCTPVLQADLFGDWREEFILNVSNSKLRVYTSDIYTENKLYTLMQDTTYRMGVAAQCVGYNQSQHLGYYLSNDGDDNRSVKPDVEYCIELPDKEIPDTPPVVPNEPDERMIFDFDGSIPSTNTYILSGSSMGNINSSGVWTYSGAQYGYLTTANEYHHSLRQAKGFEKKDGNFFVFASNGNTANFKAQNTEKSIYDSGVLSFDMSIPVSFSDNGSNSRGNADSTITVGDGTNNIMTMKYINAECALYINDELFYTFESKEDAQKWRSYILEIDVLLQSAKLRMVDETGNETVKNISFSECTNVNTFKVVTYKKWGFVVIDNLKMYENMELGYVKYYIKSVSENSVSLEMRGKENTTVSAIVAVYDNDVLTDFKIEELTLNTGINNVEINDLNISQTSQIKVMLWDSIDNMNPLNTAQDAVFFCVKINYAKIFPYNT